MYSGGFYLFGTRQNLSFVKTTKIHHSIAPHIQKMNIIHNKMKKCLIADDCPVLIEYDILMETFSN